MRLSQAHIAGIGITKASDQLHLSKFTVSAAAKALLDAGITYGDVDISFACFLENLRVPPSSFDTFGRRGAPICQVNNHSGLLAASQSVRSKQSDCALIVGFDTDEQQSQTWIIGVVLVSDLFLTSHAYLKDGSVSIRGISTASSIHSSNLNGPDLPRTIRTALDTALRQAHIEQKDLQIVDIRHSPNWNTNHALVEFEVAPRIGASSNHSIAGITGLAGLCDLVWQLRGWASGPPSKAQNCLQLVLGADGFASTVVLRRSDGRPALTWEEIRNVRDGRERLGYNPAVEMREISREDLAHVMTSSHFVPIDSPGEQLELALKGGDRAALARL